MLTQRTAISVGAMRYRELDDYCRQLKSHSQDNEDSMVSPTDAGGWTRICGIPVRLDPLLPPGRINIYCEPDQGLDWIAKLVAMIETAERSGR